MSNNKKWWQFFGRNRKSKSTGLPLLTDPIPSPLRVSNKTSLPAGLPRRRVSEPSTIGAEKILASLSKEYRVVNHDFVTDSIKVIRKLAKINPNISQAIHNIVTLGNTGHKVFFDRKVSSESVDKMRNHLINKKKEWSKGCAGMDGVVNKMISQLLISGALSNEWVPKNDLSGLESVVFVNPEDIVFILEDSTVRYAPYQRSYDNIITNNVKNLIKLNEATYKYFGLNGDTESPYGFPPYLSALNRVISQNNMHTNIDYIVEIVGLIGFLECLLDKPDQHNQNEADYEASLNKLLTEAKARIQQGLKDGVVVGFNGDHEFKFNSAGNNNLSGLMELYKANELQMFSALKSDATLAGRDYNTSETQITVIFMKMLSELKNIQNIVKTNLEFGYSMELRLAGFDFEYLTVQFNRSTIQDDYKYQQAEELKINNVMQKLILGMINQDQAADELGYETPALPKPLVDWEVLAGGKTPVDESLDKKARKKDKNASDKKTRKNKKAVPKDK